MSNSKLSALCDHVIEAGWLATVIVTPLFFSGYSSTIMDADKVALLRSIASIMAAAWLIQWIEARRLPRSQPMTSWRSPMVLPTLLVVGAYLLATATSIVPRTSLFGSYQRAQGTYTLISFVVVFAMIAQGLRTRQQRDRLIVTIILTSLPIALYGIMQKYGLDPLSWSSNFDGRSGSTVGNPIFLGAYLIMVFALTFAKVAENAQAVWAARQSGSPLLARVVLTILYALIAVAQTVALIVTDSRGPFLGWFAGVVLFVLLMALIGRKWKWVLGTVGFGFIGVLFLIALNLPNTPLARLRALPAFDRLGNLANPTGEFRLFTWENAARLVLPHAPIQFPDGAPDALNAIRPLVGYGPDAMPLVYTQVAPASSFSGDAGTDRSHNATWDAGVTTGAIGMVAYQLLFLSIFLYGFRWLDLIRTDRERNAFVGLWIGLGAAGALAAIVVGQPLYLGVALPAGNIAAIVLYLALFALGAGVQPQLGAARRGDQILLVGLLAGLFAHYVESQFGIDVPPTQTMFWVFAGLLVVLGSRQLDAAPAPALSRSSARRSALPSWVGSAVGYAIVVTTILSTLVYEFVLYAKGVSDPLLILWRGLTFNPVRNGTDYTILALILFVWIFATVLALTEMVRSHAFEPTNRLRAALLLLAALPLVLTALFALGLAAQLGALPYIPIPAPHLETVLALARQAVGIVNYYALALFVLVALMVLALFAESKSRSAAWSTSKWGRFALVPLVLITLWWINAVNLTPMRADATYRLGQLFDNQSDWNTAIALYQRAILLTPANDAYYMTLGRAYQQKSTLPNATASAQFNAGTSAAEIVSQDDARLAGLSRLDLLFAAQALLLRARELNPLYTDHTINLARFYQPELPVDAPSKTKLMDLANQYYSEAQRLSPNSVSLWNERADFDLTFENNPDAAIQKLDASLARDPRAAQTYQYLGNAYAEKNDVAAAIDAYQKALALQPKSAEAQSKVAFLYYQQGRVNDSIQAYLKYIQLMPNAQNIWEAHKNLALIYQAAGNLPAAVSEAQVAARLAPSQFTTQLADLVKQLQNQ